MSKKTLFVLWGILFGICGALGFVPVAVGEPSGVVQGLLTLISLLFFIPPVLLVYRGYREKDADVLKLVRNLSVGSLGLTLVLLVLNLLSAMQSAFLGNLLYGILVVVSTPMVCSGFWALSLFLWACLLMGTVRALRKK